MIFVGQKNIKSINQQLVNYVAQAFQVFQKTKERLGIVQVV